MERRKLIMLCYVAIISINFVITLILIFQFRQQNQNKILLNYDTLITIIIVFLVSNVIIIYYAIYYYIENFSYNNQMSTTFNFNELLLINAEQNPIETQETQSIITILYQMFKNHDNYNLNNEQQQQQNNSLIV